MPDMLVVATGEARHPMVLVIFVETDDRLFHGFSSRFRAADAGGGLLFTLYRFVMLCPGPQTPLVALLGSLRCTA